MYLILPYAVCHKNCRCSGERGSYLTDSAKCDDGSSSSVWMFQPRFLLAAVSQYPCVHRSFELSRLFILLFDFRLIVSLHQCLSFKQMCIYDSLTVCWQKSCHLRTQHRSISVQNSFCYLKDLQCLVRMCTFLTECVSHFHSHVLFLIAVDLQLDIFFSILMVFLFICILFVALRYNIYFIVRILRCEFLTSNYWVKNTQNSHLLWWVRQWWVTSHALRCRGWSLADQLEHFYCYFQVKCSTSSAASLDSTRTFSDFSRYFISLSTSC